MFGWPVKAQRKVCFTVCRCGFGASSWRSSSLEPGNALGEKRGSGVKRPCDAVVGRGVELTAFCARVTKRCLCQKRSFLCPHPSHYVCPAAKYDFRSSQKKREDRLRVRDRCVCVCVKGGREVEEEGQLLNSLLCINQQAEPPRMGEEDQDKDCKCSEDVTATPPLLLPCGH